MLHRDLDLFIYSYFALLWMLILKTDHCSPAIQHLHKNQVKSEAMNVLLSCYILPKQGTLQIHFFDKWSKPVLLVKLKYEGDIQRSCGINQEIYSG